MLNITFKVILFSPLSVETLYLCFIFVTTLVISLFSLEINISSI